jgi:hypothetical protein
METNTNQSLWQQPFVKNCFNAGALVLLLLGVFLLAQTANAIKQYAFIGEGEETQHTISVEGSSEVLATPDVATFTFSVEEERETVGAAQDIATEKGNAAIEYLQENGVEEKDIKTTNYSVQPQYDFIRGECREDGYCPPGQRQLRGFEVRQTVEVKVRDTQDAGTLLSGLGEIGVSRVSGLNFTVDDDESLKQQARERAIEDAKEKAQRLAEDLDVQLKRIVNFRESRDVPMYARDAAMGMGGDAMEEGAAPNLPTGENTITSNVQITYEIR